MATNPFLRGRSIPFLLTVGVSVLVCLVPFLPGRSPTPPQEDSAIPAALQESLDKWVAEHFPGNPEDFQDNLADSTARYVTYGAQVYEQYCSGCHGIQGDGQGEAANFLVPRPRNFRYGVSEDSPPIYKFRSTRSGQAPLVDDLVRTIRDGLPGSAMPKHRLLDPTDARAVADYVIWLSQTAEFEQAILFDYQEEEPDLDDQEERDYFYEEFVVASAERIAGRYANPDRLAIGQEIAVTDESIARGQTVYMEKGCHECHGNTGRGEGSSAGSLRDDWGYPIDPRDFSTGKFRAGSSGRDIYMRIKGGVSGTPMPAYEDMPNEDLWALVHFVQSLKTGGE
ncbi:MAG: hypothetical protein DWQ01_20255 [Planctomycetota bacterium]|nr:MAG: hypothetical protein DWQ01_20255 [Planctomycetota bacterium]